MLAGPLHPQVNPSGMAVGSLAPVPFSARAIGSKLICWIEGAVALFRERAR
ncbi:hypothetical protein [Kitasatospora sp. NPDC092286]|uniref:hypothetical protein n=1 Tax=Kitasatospora sp. NPDC092286 TaxID=3364087 RepID=UPI00380B8735